MWMWIVGFDPLSACSGNVVPANYCRLVERSLVQVRVPDQHLSSSITRCCFTVFAVVARCKILTPVALSARCRTQRYCFAFQTSTRPLVYPVYTEKRVAFLTPNSPRLPLWLPRSSRGRRPTTRSAGRRYCRRLICQPSGRLRRRRATTTHCRQSARSWLAATHHGRRRAARRWRRTSCSGRAATRRSSCRRCRLWRRWHRRAQTTMPMTHGETRRWRRQGA